MNRLLIILCYLWLIIACQPVPQDKNSLVPLEQLNKLSAATTPASAHWIKNNLIYLPKPTSPVKHIHILTWTDKKVMSKRLNYIKRNKKTNSYAPQLSQLQPYSLSITYPEIKQWLKQPLAVLTTFKNQKKHIQFIQTGELLDFLYTQKSNDADNLANYGAKVKVINTSADTGDIKNIQVTFRLWAPTAQSASVVLLDQNKSSLSRQKITLNEDKNSGSWSATITGEYHLAYYQYQLTLYQPRLNRVVTIKSTDPYSNSLSINSDYSQIVDLTSTISMPDGWEKQQDIPLKHPEDTVIYETHIGEFSAHDQSLSRPSYQHTYKAFSEKNSYGIRHLMKLQQAGINHIQLLPSADFSAVNENIKRRISLNDTLDKVCTIAPETSICNTKTNKDLTLHQLLSSYLPNTAKAQALTEELRNVDDYDWGYNPLHYTVPEGSYAVNPEGYHRIVEFREMIQSLHNMGFRVLMDVVYNHAFTQLLGPASILDKIVPNYYHTRNIETGFVSSNELSNNTATERVMMEKLITDSLVTWAKHYKIDGFRFHLINDLPKSLLLKARKAVRKVDPDTYFYGEGSNSNSIAANATQHQIKQASLAGTSIGQFNDSLTNVIRGKSKHVAGFKHRKNQGIGNGLGSLPNELQDPNHQQSYLAALDILRLGLTGNLKLFPLTSYKNKRVKGRNLSSKQQVVGTALDPADTINYVSKHNGQTLWDNHQYRIAYQATTSQRVRMHNQSLSYIVFAQGISFIQMGSELLRSKSFLNDNGNGNNWFNQVNFNRQSNNYQQGLPPAITDKANWSLINTLRAQNQQRDIIHNKEINAAENSLLELLTIRSSSPLFRLTSAQDIIKKVSFLNTGKQQQQGLIVMLLDDTVGSNVDPKHEKILVVFNTTPHQQSFSHPKLNGLSLHPVQQRSYDKITAQSAIQGNTATVPGFTTAVFIQ